MNATFQRSAHHDDHINAILSKSRPSVRYLTNECPIAIVAGWYPIGANWAGSGPLHTRKTPLLNLSKSVGVKPRLQHAVACNVKSNVLRATRCRMREHVPSAALGAGWSAVYRRESERLCFCLSLGLAAETPHADRPVSLISLFKHFIEECGGEADIARHCMIQRIMTHPRMLSTCDNNVHRCDRTTIKTTKLVCAFPKKAATRFRPDGESRAVALPWQACLR
jgi:hypothetical protein